MYMVASHPLFLGSGCYDGRSGKEMVRFIERNDFTGRSIALFGTSGDDGWILGVLYLCELSMITTGYINKVCDSLLV